MKKVINISMIALFTITFVSCKKEGNKAVIKKDNSQETVLADNGEVDSTVGYNTDIKGNKSIKTDYVYQATDGSPVKVIFDYNPDDRNVSIRSNNKTFILKKAEAKPNETVYEKEDMKATVKGDSLVIRQGDNVIQLVKTRL
ncbi:hypothetical protein [Chryseobacterium oryzae]|uniref:Lipoprotein n=1 Tax=Chryseobacterium oryzae TaxID=2929799 RepID=A0ABY4BH31_9FLAO|nr:hypothetical protein [Chryseobacterium oryzae]UOE38478.1 hypothetical protein MTP08_01475 [Chryseobacterium oryzae]